LAGSGYKESGLGEVCLALGTRCLAQGVVGLAQRTGCLAHKTVCLAHGIVCLFHGTGCLAHRIVCLAQGVVGLARSSMVSWFCFKAQCRLAPLVCVLDERPFCVTLFNPQKNVALHTSAFGC
jgi:hypothetical protein